MVFTKILKSQAKWWLLYIVGHFHQWKSQFASFLIAKWFKEFFKGYKSNYIPFFWSFHLWWGKNKVNCLYFHQIGIMLNFSFEILKKTTFPLYLQISHVKDEVEIYEIKWKSRKTPRRNCLYFINFCVLSFLHIKNRIFFFSFTRVRNWTGNIQRDLNINQVKTVLLGKTNEDQQFWVEN